MSGYKNKDELHIVYYHDVVKLALDNPLRVEYMMYFRNNVPVEDVYWETVKIFPETDPYRIAYCEYLQRIPFAEARGYSLELLPLDNEYRLNYIDYISKTKPEYLAYCLRMYPKYHHIWTKYPIQVATSAPSAPLEPAYGSGSSWRERQRNSAAFVEAPLEPGLSWMERRRLKQTREIRREDQGIYPAPREAKIPETSEELVNHYKQLGLRSADPSVMRTLELDHPLRIEYMNYIRKHVTYDDILPDEMSVFPETDPYRIEFCNYLRLIPFEHADINFMQFLQLDDEYRVNYIRHWTA